MVRALLAVAAVAAFAAPSPAVIKALTPLKRVMSDTPIIFVAEVDTVAPEKPGVVFKFVENLKGKAPAERFAVNLTGDNFAKKDDHTKVMLERLAPGRKLILFARFEDDVYTTFGFMEGTWFQLRGAVDADKKTIRWAFLHCEPYFRRTFKGTTAELKAVVADAVAGKKDPPEPDEKEPHGYGPPAEKEKKEPGKEEPLAEEVGSPRHGGERAGVGRSPHGAGQDDANALPSVSRRTGTSSVPFASVPFHIEPLFGVIPSSVLLGPLAILAAIFPSTFAGVLSGMARWRALMVVVSANSILATAFFFSQKYLPDAWWCGLPALSCVLLFNLAVGIVWSGRRHRVAVSDDSATADPPTPRECLGLAAFAGVVGLLLVGMGWWFGWAELLKNPGREFTAAFVGLAVAALYSGYRIATRELDSEAPPPRAAAPGETVALSVMLLFGAVLLTTLYAPVGGGSGPTVTEAAPAAPSVTSPKLQDFELWYESAAMDKALSGACVTDGFVYLGGWRQTAFNFAGVLACVNKSTGKEEWVFDSKKVPKAWKTTDNHDRLRTVYSTPTVANGNLYFGEGLHEDSDCRLFCLNAATGEPKWVFHTTSHTEGSPVIVGGKVYFSAGDDGMFCADADTGKQLWQYPKPGEKPLHIDTPLTVANGKVYGGSGYQNFAAFCLEAEMGKELWRIEMPLRSFGTPVVSGVEVFYGLGTGNLTDDLSTEKEPGRPVEKVAGGMVLCMDATTGKERWRADLPRSAHTQMAADGRHLYAASRDGWLYALDRTNGKPVWRASSGLPITSGVAVATDASGRFPLAVYLAGPTGNVTCHDPLTGGAYWSRGITELTGRRAEVQAPPTIRAVGDTGREVFVPVTLTNKNNAETRAGLVRFTDTDALFPLLVKGLERFEKAGFVK